MTSLKFKSAVPSNYSIIAAILAVIIGIFFTYNLYNDSFQKSEELTALRATSTSLTTTLDTLNTLKKSADSSKESDKYVGVARDDLLLESVFALAGNGADIGSVSFDTGELLTSGLTLAGINITVDTENLDTLLKFIDRATGVDAKRRFLVKSLNFAYESAVTTAPITATIQLGAYTIK